MLKKIKVQSLASNPWVLLVIAVLAAGLLTFWVYRFLDGREAAMKARLAAEMNRHKRVAVLVPVRDVPAGTPIGNSDFASRDVPADLVFEDVIRASDFDSLSNLKLVRAVSRGRPVRRADVEALQARDFSDMLEVGKRALTIEVDALNSADKMLKPGNHIDLYLISSAGAATAGGAAADSKASGKTARLLLSNLAVIATGQDVRPRDLGEAFERQRSAQQAGGDPALAGYDSLTLSVSPEQAARIALAQKVGSLRAVLRNATDKKATPAITLNEQALYSDDVDTEAVQYIVGGSGKGNLLSTVPEMPDAGIQSVAGVAAGADAALAAAQKLVGAQQASMDRLSSAMSGAVQPGN
ncbi:Flp pilus assembly protein CpaB [Cupriavidus basilensis OR16]|uniref:Flp pilus assembly protein CpaB n=1 Tax=Cupriavidus basilensis OR16 TaxID=1127483 RepID=H1SC41_9BURK|nr:Flp pilus assembly protein CpaB [Cupriavidus basilensis]EHP39914.1 Flp pilus assembly protein CpaB [Cupriavidus basilensis OR16]